MLGLGRPAGIKGLQAHNFKGKEKDKEEDESEKTRARWLGFSGLSERVVGVEVS